MNTIQESIAALLSGTDKPRTAYELMADLSEKTGRRVAPPTVYRALEQMIAAGLVARIESRNAYRLCAHPDHQHSCVFLVCRSCGASEEVEDRELERQIVRDASARGFRVERPVVEVLGTCAACLPAPEGTGRV